MDMITKCENGHADPTLEKYNCSKCGKLFCEDCLYIRPNNVAFPDSYFITDYRLCYECVDHKPCGWSSRCIWRRLSELYNMYPGFRPPNKRRLLDWSNRELLTDK